VGQRAHQPRPVLDLGVGERGLVVEDGQALELALLGQGGDLGEPEARPYAGQAVEEAHQVLQVLAVFRRFAQEAQEPRRHLDTRLRPAHELRAELVQPVVLPVRCRRGGRGPASPGLPYRGGGGIEGLGTTARAIFLSRSISDGITEAVRKITGMGAVTGWRAADRSWARP
jgi:hypothetical protein